MARHTMMFLVVWLLMVLESESLLIETPDYYNYIPVPIEQLNTRCHSAMSFKVKARQDAHVGLQTFYNSKDIFYKVVLGGWGNRRSVVRRTDHGADETFYTGTVMDESKFKSYWVSWAGGVIAVGRGLVVGEQLMMSFPDPDPHVVNYVGVSTGWGATGQWDIEPHPCRRQMFAQKLGSSGLFTPDRRSESLDELLPSRSYCMLRCVSVVWCKCFSYTPSENKCTCRRRSNS